MFTFHLVDPAPFQGTKLQMYVRQDPDWKTLPVASKLYKVARVAGGPFMRGQDVTKSLFLRKIFKCELAVVGTGAAAYSIVKTITEKVAGMKPKGDSYPYRYLYQHLYQRLRSKRIEKNVLTDFSATPLESSKQRGRASNPGCSPAA